MLENAGFQVRVAESGAAGVERFQEWRPHFVWMDLHMPLMDGIEAARRIRTLEGGQDVKIAAATASGFENHRSEVLAAGLDDYVRKPYRPEEIFDCMSRHLGVRYRRADMAPKRPEDRSPAALSADAIAQLPPALRIKLRTSLVALDARLISQTIDEVAEHDAVLGAALARYAEKFAYSPILNAVDAVREASPASSD